MRAFLRRAWGGGYLIGLGLSALILALVPVPLDGKLFGLCLASVLAAVAVGVDLRRRPDAPSYSATLLVSVPFESLSELPSPCLGVLTSGPHRGHHFTAAAVAEQAECIVLRAPLETDLTFDGSLSEIDDKLRTWDARVVASARARTHGLRAFRVQLPQSI